jgi:sugar phosphate isomerase/epimerase
MRPQLLFCHAPFGKDLQRIRAYVANHQYAGVEWAWDGWRLMLPQDRRGRRLADLHRASPCSSAHAPYTDLEIGHRDPHHAAAAVRILQDYIDATGELGAHHLNMHVGSYALAPEELSWEGLVRNVGTLLEYAARRGVRLTVENLRDGVTSNPETFTRLLEATGAPVTFDLGHAHGSAWVQNGRGSVVEFLRSIPTPILATHIYWTEHNDTHFVPEKLSDIAPALDALVAAVCDFWVLELHTQETLEQTRRIVDEYLAASRS